LRVRNTDRTHDTTRNRANRNSARRGARVIQNRISNRFKTFQRIRLKLRRISQWAIFYENRVSRSIRRRFSTLWLTGVKLLPFPSIVQKLNGNKNDSSELAFNALIRGCTKKYVRRATTQRGSYRYGVQKCSRNKHAGDNKRTGWQSQRPMISSRRGTILKSLTKVDKLLHVVRRKLLRAEHVCYVLYSDTQHYCHA